MKSHMTTLHEDFVQLGKRVSSYNKTSWVVTVCFIEDELPTEDAEKLYDDLVEVFRESLRE